MSYYIVQYLKIYHNNGSASKLTLDVKKKSYYEMDISEQKYFDNKNLIPSINPVMIYENHVFNEKYKDLLQHKLNDFNNVSIVIMIEKRFDFGYEFLNYPYF
jgi:hypothetical protein